jgi:hypothetical protein
MRNCGHGRLHREEDPQPILTARTPTSATSAVAPVRSLSHEIQPCQCNLARLEIVESDRKKELRRVVPRYS